MAVINDLPNETLIRIWQHVLQPDDIESFAQVSRRIYALAAPFLAAYKKLKSRFTNYDNIPRSRRLWNPLLRELCLNPHHGYYILTLKIHSWLERWGDFNWYSLHSGRQYMALYRDRNPYRMSHQPYSAEDVELFVQTAKTTEAFADFSVRAIHRKIESGNEIPILALIIMRLSNLRTLVIDPMEDDRGVHPFFTDIMSDAFSSRETYLSFPSRLENIEIHHGELELVRKLASIPSVKTMSCWQVGNVHGPTMPYESSDRSAIFELTLRDCYITADEVAGLIAGTDNLKIFRLEDIYNPTKIFDPVSILATLHKYARRTLRELVLHCEIGAVESVEEIRLVDLHGFELLEDFRTDFVFLKPRVPNRNEDIVASLPRSLVSFGLRRYAGPRVKGFTRLIQTLLDAKSTQLPFLQRLKFDSYWTPMSVNEGEQWITNGQLKAMCEQRGVQLEL